MGMVVKNNMSAVRTLNTLNGNTTALQKSLQKVSSGMKINSAQDDASGYAISERMRVRIRSLDQANQNSQNDSSLMKTAEGAVGNTVEILRALKEKAINAANDSNTDEDRQTIQKEIDQFIDQIDDNALVQFNGKYLVDGSKNNVTNADGTKTILLNQSLDIATAKDSALTTLNNRAGDSLGIQTTDKYQVSWVQNGTTYFTSGTVGSMTLENLLGSVSNTDNAVTGPGGKISEAVAIADPAAAASYDISKDTDNYESAGTVTLANSSPTSYADSTRATAAGNAFDAVSSLGLSKTGAADDATALAASDIQTLTQSDPYTTTLYYQKTTTDSEGNETYSAQAVTLQIEYKGQVSGDYTYELTVTDDSDGTELKGAQTLYKAKASSGAAGSAFTDAADKFGRAVYTPDKTEGVAVAAATAGVKGQLAGLTISILDQDGNVKKAANAALDQFKQYQRAENPSGDKSLNFHIGSEANVAIKVGMGDMRSEALGLKSSTGERILVTTKENANAAINVIENALTKALDQQTTIGAIEARLEYTSTNLTTSSENVQAAESTIRDADMAKEMTNYTKSNVLLQAAQAMLAQANQNSSAVLSLLQ